LKTIYTLEDAMIIWESVAVTRYNEALAADHARLIAKKGGGR